jgi:Icc-related predicted phosphoesterase
MTERKIRVLTVSDIHSVATLLDELQQAVERHKPDILACVGDIIDFEARGRGMLPPSECGKRIANMPVARTVFVRGNHEHYNWHEFAAEWRGKQQKLVTLHGEAFVHGPLVIVGFPCLLGDEDAFRGDRPLLEIEPDTWLRPLLKRYGSAMRTLWLMHEPPLGTPLAPETGVIAGYREWMEAVEWMEPKLVVFGHDHNTSRKKKIWHHKLACGTTCINVGQDSPLRYTLIEMTFASQKPSLPTGVQVTANVGGREFLALT